jgi:hypothetical protein
LINRVDNRMIILFGFLLTALLMWQMTQFSLQMGMSPVIFPDCCRGFDAQSGEYVDMVRAGIIDPTKVVRLALRNAASVAGLLVTTEAMVADKPKKETAPAMPAGGGMEEDY